LYAAILDSWNLFVTKAYPWKLMVFTTALCLAYQLDTKNIGKLGYPTLRWIEGALQASVALVTAYATYSWITDINPNVIPHMNAKGEMVGLMLDSLLIRSAIIGFVIGYTIPYWYKVSPKDRVIEKDEEIPVNNKSESAMQKA
jgi:hypothetical protein